MNFAQRYVDSIRQHFTQVRSYFYSPIFGYISDMDACIRSEDAYARMAIDIQS